MPLRPFALALLLLPVACASFAPPRAPDYPAPASEQALDRRLDFLEERLDAGRMHAAAWSWGWLGFLGVTGAQSIASAASEHDANDRAGDITNAAKSAIGIADVLLLRPMPGRIGAAPMRELEGGARDDKLARLARGEATLAAAAERARQRSSWPTHLANLLFNAAGSAILLGLGHENAAWLTFATGFAGGELQIWSEPWRGRRDLADYEKLVGSSSASLREPEPSWRAAFTGRGVAVELRF